MTEMLYDFIILLHKYLMIVIDFYIILMKGVINYECGRQNKSSFSVKRKNK